MMLIRVLSGRGSRGVTAPRVHQSKRGKGCVGDDENDHRHHVCDSGDNADDDRHQGRISFNEMIFVIMFVDGHHHHHFYDGGCDDDNHHGDDGAVLVMMGVMMMVT